MNSSAQFLNPSEAARRLGVSAKALRLYEERGLIAPARTAAGWRAYGPDEMARVAEIAALRELGLSLAQVARVLEGDSKSLEPALAAHQAALEGRVHQLAGAVDKLADVVQQRGDDQRVIGAGETGDLSRLQRMLELVHILAIMVAAEALEVLGDQPRSRGYAIACYYLGDSLLALGRNAEALARLEHAEKCMRDLGAQPEVA